MADRCELFGSQLQPAGDLLGCPVLMQTLNHKARQIIQVIQHEAFRPAGQIARFGRLRSVAAIGIGITL